jgi:hypothetical protein
MIIKFYTNTVWHTREKYLYSNVTFIYETVNDNVTFRIFVYVWP